LHRQKVTEVEKLSQIVKEVVLMSARNGVHHFAPCGVIGPLLLSIHDQLV
jgi:hypothetical protein